MEVQALNKDVLELLLGASSKKMVKKLVEDCFTLRNSIHAMKPESMTPVMTGLEEALGINEATSKQLIIELVKFIFLICRNDFNSKGVFPPDMNAQLAKMLGEIAESNEEGTFAFHWVSFSLGLGFNEEWKKNITNELGDGSKLLSVNWNVTVETASKRGDASNELMILMEIESFNPQTTQSETNLLQMDRKEVLTLHQNFQKIKEHLDQLVH